jgi:hypothetical protein
LFCARTSFAFAAVVTTSADEDFVGLDIAVLRRLPGGARAAAAAGFGFRGLTDDATDAVLATLETLFVGADDCAVFMLASAGMSVIIFLSSLMRVNTADMIW